jgi:phospholipid/cholesterol/gamma-HCH transport system substrate-binding protein
VSKVLVKQRDALDEVLQVAPTALTNLFHTYNPATGTLDTRTNVGENVGDLTSDPARIICGILNETNANPTQAQKLGQLCTSLGSALGRSGALRSAPSREATDVEHIDRSLGGVVEVKR